MKPSHPWQRLRWIAAVAALSLPLAAPAHRAWILPAATVLSSDDPWVTVDAAVSNDIFHTDFNPIRAAALNTLTPDGTEIPMRNLSEGKHRTTFDLQLTQRGTYKVFSASQGLAASWREDGKPRRWPARGVTPTREAFDREVPKQADQLVVTQSSRRVETFITAGAPSDAVLQPSNVGLELVPVTHPNDLFAGEPAQFRFLIDGKPAAGVRITVLAGGMRYRNAQDAIELTSDADGGFSIRWPQAGPYFLEARYEDGVAPKPASRRRGSYTATFEVLPQ